MSEAESGTGTSLHMHTIEHTYISLLADIGHLSGVPSIGRSAYDGLEWCVYDAPKLEREVLSYIENGTDFSTSWPRWLIPLRDLFIKGESPTILRYLRQLLLFCYKAAHRLDNETYKTFAKQWARTQIETSLFDPDSLSGFHKEVLQRARSHCTASLARVDWKKIIPYHGPGAVYDSNRNKGLWTKWFETIESCYPYAEYFYLPGTEHWLSQPLYPSSISEDIHARLIAVPKDARGPRLICVHPTESVWIQEGLRDKLERSITRRFIHPWNWPQGQVHFDDQTWNGTLALQASIDRRFATLDLKEASDRLSDCLIRYLFGSHYRWFGCCRAEKADIPVLNKTVHVSCYAPMGNATTFPVQSLAFWAICVSTLEAIGSADRLLVFGDDIIVPSAHAPLVIEVLEAFGLRVNHSKSFFKGAFRESCGVDAYKGALVTPVRWKTDYDPRSPAGLMAACSIAQNLRKSGYHQSSVELYSHIRAVLKERTGKVLPCTNNPEHGGICEYTESLSSVWSNAYWHRNLQKFVTPCIRLREASNSFPSGWNQVLTSLTSLLRTGRSNDPANSPSRRVLLNRGWTDIL